MFRFGDMYERLGEIRKNPILGKMKPCRIVGNTYFVGTYQASAHLLDTGEGLILIDTGYENTAEFVLESIRALGFRPEDIRYVVHTHWHGDHTAATPKIVAASGAKTLIGRADAERVKRFFEPDILIDDGDTLSLGNTTLRFLHTPGHTAGTVSFFYETEDNGRTLSVGSFGGAGVNTLSEDTLEFEDAREAYLRSLDRLSEERIDVFVGNHVWNNDTYHKSIAFKEGANPFINDKLFGTFLMSCRRRLMDVIAKENAKM